MKDVNDNMNWAFNFVIEGLTRYKKDGLMILLL